MGSIRVRPETGQLFFDFRYRGERCREQTSLADTPANRKRLEKALAKIEADMAAGSFDYEATFPGSRSTPRSQLSLVAAGPHTAAALVVSLPTPAPAQAAADLTPSFKDFTGTWLAEHRIEWRRSHMKVLDSTLDGHLLPEFGSRPVSSITKADVLTFRAKLADKPGRTGAKLSNKRINNILGVLRQIMAEAADRYDFITPCANLKALKIRKSDVQPFTLDEVQRMLAVVRADWRDYFLVRFFTGMRTGEAHGLKWKYVDFDRRLILIRETFVLGEDEYTKTDSSQRDIQMSQPVFEALKRQQEATGKRDYVFCNRAGQPIDNKNFSDRVYYPLLRHLGLERRRPYQMRHTAATLWLASGEAPEWIARQLGHANTQMLFQVYSRYVPNLTRRDGSAMDRLLASRFASGNVAAASGHEPANDVASRAQPPPLTWRQAA